MFWLHQAKNFFVMVVTMFVGSCPLVAYKLLHQVKYNRLWKLQFSRATVLVVLLQPSEVLRSGMPARQIIHWDSEKWPGNPGFPLRFGVVPNYFTTLNHAAKQVVVMINSNNNVMTRNEHKKQLHPLQLETTKKKRKAYQEGKEPLSQRLHISVQHPMLPAP